MKTNLKQGDNQALVVCGHCGEQQVVHKHELTEAVDAFGDFIDIYYKDQEYERLSRREERLLEKQQYTELTLVYSFLADTAQINANKAMEEFELNKDPEDLSNAEKWQETAKQYKDNETKLREQLKSGIIVDAVLEEGVYDEIEDNPFDEGEAKISEKPKRKSNIEDVLGDLGFLEF